MNGAALQEFCTHWGIRELALFGSVLRDDFGPDSDVDVLVEFLPGHGLTFENAPEILDALEALFRRPVDLVEKSRIKNPFRRASILAGSRVLYAA
ncbi:MAG: nucleotidyltransferase domain-containing protein [Phycisphaerales bacterium]|nr:nucleotidyltransferase domain-containing protein [Phycisphaerales bacterium]